MNSKGIPSLNPGFASHPKLMQMTHFPRFMVHPFLLSAIVLLSVTASIKGQQPHGGRLDPLQTWQDFDEVPKLHGLDDVNGDGIRDLLLARIASSSGGFSNGGAVELISGANGNILHVWYGETEDSEFGIAMDTVADVDGDGARDILIGAHGTEIGGSVEQGKVYLFSGAAPFALIQSWDGIAQFGGFGSSLSEIGDINGNGYSEFIVGAPQANSGFIYEAGIIYVYSSNLPQSTGLVYEIQGPFDAGYLGYEVVGTGDLTGDGIPDFAAGEPGEEPPVSFWYNPGRVRIYSGATGIEFMILYGDDDNDFFGSALSSIGDANGDTFPDLLVGAPYHGGLSGLYDSGFAGVYSGATGEELISWIGAGDFDLLGMFLSAMDVDGDGIQEAMIGAPGFDRDGVSNLGLLYMNSPVTGETLAQIKGTKQNEYVGIWPAPAGDVNLDGSPDFFVSSFGRGAFPLGTATLYSGALVPQMTANGNSIQNSTGGAIRFDLDFPTEAAFYWYQLLYSGAGTGPIQIQGLDVPLSYDLFLVNSYLGNYEGSFSNPSGLLDAAGNGAVDLTIPAGAVPPGILNQTIYFAAISRLAWGTWEYASVALPVTFLP
ncbi:MAG: hypothetical protein DWQ01_00925 [Planctomycetota bacterium]|nr:MAG: hypothetical protein DWQ01_00925 [Planctomycetota bacterium]